MSAMPATSKMSRTPAPSTDESEAVSSKKPRRHPLRVIVLIAFLLCGSAWGYRAVHRILAYEETENAYLTGHVHQVASRISGTVTEVLVEENTDVKKGDVLVRLDPRDTQSRIEQAAAQFAQAEAQVTHSDSQIADAKARVAQAEAQFKKAQSDYGRVKDLSDKKVASKQEFDAATAAFDAARAGVESARAAAKASEASRQMMEAQKQTAQAVLDDARLQNSYTVITAPSDGRVGRRNVEVGNRLQPGQPVFAIVEPEVWIEANFKETQLSKMRKGQNVEVTIDALPGAHFEGTVESFSPASGAQFAMLPPDNATGNFTKVVQRVPVRIHFDPQSIAGFADRLRPGLSAVVSVRVK
jgi:membrane fusion protein (multidrug efflux system)